MKLIALFASGTGTNSQNIIDHFRHHAGIRVSLIACNNPGAGVLGIAAKENIPQLILDREKFFRGNAYVEELKEKKIDFLVLAGFLWKIPRALVEAYRGRIINIHPSLLPKYGGKGMYGRHVHESVLTAGDPQTGITIHYVDELYDHGQVIFQAFCPVDPADTADTLAQKVHRLEYTHFPKIIEEVITATQNG
jgi:phosphoribosylglycinamide formyltransferase-1